MDRQPDLSLAGLRDFEAQAIADILPLLASGEEAAAMAFVRLADTPVFSDATSTALRMIGAEEDVHLALLTALAGVLPPPDHNPGARHGSRVFHFSLTRGGAMLHLARIAAIDSAVCTILSRLLAKGTPIGNSAHLSRLFMRIRSDESRHVAVARHTISMEPDRRALRDAGASAREGLAVLLEPASAAFASLGVDPDGLRRDVRGLPCGLL